MAGLPGFASNGSSPKSWLPIAKAPGYAQEPNLYSTTSLLTLKLPRVPLIDFTLSNARRFYSSMGNPTGVKGLEAI